MEIKLIETIIYVADQHAASRFYEKVLRRSPSLEVPGMTEFQLADNFKLGLMPNDGIARILGDSMPHPKSGTGIPRCELYLYVEDVEAEQQNAVTAGAKLLSAAADRNWGDRACYVADLDGHIIAFARTL